MLLLVTIGLVVVGAISLVIGFVSNSLGPIYISIACSVIAGVVLVVFSRMARRKEGAPAPAAAAAPSPGSWAPASPPPPAPSPPPVTRVEPAPAPPPRRPEPVRTMTAPQATTTFTAPRGGDVDDVDFPIADYDKLRASQILDQLGDLTLDELDMVREREEQGKNRATIIRRVDLRIDALEAEEDGDVASGAAERPAPAEPFPAVGEDEPEPAGADDFPIANYDQLSADEIISMLDDLDDDELDMVAEREEQGQNRLEILDYIDEMFEEVGPDGQPVPPPAPPARGPTAAPPAARKTAGKKAAAKKAGVKKIATPVAGATRAAKATKGAKKAPARQAAKAAPAPAAAGARKTAGPAKKTAAGASPGTKAAARRTAGPAKATAGRATVKKAVKAAAKKVPPAKKG